MSHEFEAKFLHIHPETLRARLTEAGYTCTQPETLMRRKVFLHPHNPEDAWVRVRDEGGKITMTAKQITKKDAMEGVLESEVVVSDFHEAARLLEMCGLQSKSFQETRRESWEKGTMLVTIDTWPGLPPFAEVEGETPEMVWEEVEKLGFDNTQALFGAVDAVYERLLNIPPAQINAMPLITFDSPPQRMGA